MAKSTLKSTATIVFVLATLLSARPARGQQPTVTTTLNNLMFGVDPTDPTMTWTTTLRLVNRTSNAMHNEDVSILDADGNQAFGMGTTVYGGGAGTTNGGIYYVSPLGESELTIVGLTPTTVATPLHATIRALRNDDGLPDIVGSALVQKTDSNGLVVQSYEVVDSSTVKRVPGQSFGFGADIFASGADESFIMSNPSGGITANVTVSVYDGYNTATTSHTPITSITFPVFPGNTISQTFSQLFALNTDLTKLFANPPIVGVVPQPDPLLQQFIAVTADQPIALSISRTNAGSDGSLFATQSFAFPLAPASTIVARRLPPRRPIRAPGLHIGPFILQDVL